MRISLPSVKSTSSQKGLSLVELLVSLLIGLFIMAGVLQLFAISTQNAITSSGANKIQENIRYTLSRISDDIAQTGNLGCMSASTVENAERIDPVNNMLTFLSDPGEVYNFDGLVYGSNDVANVADMADDTDDLTLRYVSHVTRFEIDEDAEAKATTVSVDEAAVGFNTLQDFQIVAVSDCSSTNIFMIDDIDATNGNITFDGSQTSNSQENDGNGLSQPMYPNNPDITSKGNNRSIPYLYAGSTGTYRYFIDTSASAGAQSCDVNDDDDRRFCSLFRANGNNSQELVEGVHDLQITYGWINAAGNLQFADAANVPDVDGNGFADWELIDRVQVTLAFNSVDNAAGTGNIANTLLTKEITQVFNLPNQL